MVSGPDGNLWITEYGAHRIGRVTPDGTITDFPLPGPAGAPFGITVGSDGNLWFTVWNTSGGSIGRITTDGTITEFSLPTSTEPEGIVSGADGNIWFTEFDRNAIGRLKIPPSGR